MQSDLGDMWCKWETINLNLYVNYYVISLDELLSEFVMRELLSCEFAI